MVLKSIVKKETHERVKQELPNSFKENDDEEKPGFNKTANKTKDPQEAIQIIHHYEDIKTQDKKAIGYIGKRRKPLKNFKDIEQFFENVVQSQSTIHFKNSLYKFLKKYPILKRSILSPPIISETISRWSRPYVKQVHN